jgi:hypothetical protein
VLVELMPLLRKQTLLITVARVGEKVKINLIHGRAASSVSVIPPLF